MHRSGRVDRARLIEIVKRLSDFHGTEEELLELTETLISSVPHPEVTDLIFYSDRDRTPEEIVDEALSYRGIAL